MEKMVKMEIEHLISRTTYRVRLDGKSYTCCLIDCEGRVRVSMGREWGFPWSIRPHTELWEKIYKAVRDKYEPPQH